MVTIEHDGEVSRINESKLRKDHDPWRDNPLPPLLEEGRVLNPAGERPPAEPPPGSPDKEEEKESQQAAVAADSLWVVKHQGKINFLALCRAAVASETCSEGGMAVGEPMDILQGHDLSTTEGQKLAWKNQGTGA